MDENEQTTSSNYDPNRPSPDDFEVYLPWACDQMQVYAAVVITKVLQDEYVSVVADRKPRGKNKPAPSRPEVYSDQDKDDKSIPGIQSLGTHRDFVRITAIYDNSDNLVHLKFVNNRNIPRTLLKIIGLILKFHIYLTSITINRGLDRYSIHELSKILSTSRLTDICLDGTFLVEANYYLLFQTDNKLQNISLARCKLDDNVISKIAKSLPSSKMLSVLNLSSNRITDTGAKDLAIALKSNRYLLYLNLAGNMITDEGASALLDTLMEFPLTSEELLKSRCRYMMYLKEKKEMVANIVIDLKCSDDKKGKKVLKPAGRPSNLHAKKGVKGLEKELSLKAVSDANKSFSNIDAVFFEKAEVLAVNAMGIFTDPFSNTQTTSRDGIIYCYGNNTLCYLNLSYNNLSYLILKKILNVLLYQKLMDRKPRGLINMSIEGNCLPVSCKELAQIDDLLDTGLMVHNRRFSVVKKRPGTRSGK